MFVRLILLLLVLGAAFVAVRRVQNAVRGSHSRRVVDARTVQCADCGVYFPREEAIVVDGRSYCSRAHADRPRS